MKYLKPIALLLLVFIAGLSVGIVATRNYMERQIRKAVRQPELVRLRIERELTRDLALDATQQTKLDEILSNMQREIATARTEHQPRFRLIFADAQRRIYEMLNPEQQQKFEKLQAEYGIFSFGGQGQLFPRLQKLRNLREGTPNTPPSPP